MSVANNEGSVLLPNVCPYHISFVCFLNLQATKPFIVTPATKGGGWLPPEMLTLVLVLKDSLRTFFKSLSGFLGVRSLSLSLSLGVRSRRSCPCPGPWGSGPCPYPGPCGIVLVLVFSPYKDLFPLFHYSDLFA